MTMQIVTINIPVTYLDAFKSLIDLGLYDSRSQIVRECLKEFLEKDHRFITELKEDKQIFSKIKRINK